MIRELRPTTSGWAIILLSAAALTLGACGRKGPLELPPTSHAPVASAPASVDTEADAAAKPSVFNSTYGAEAGPTASRGVKKPFVLDPLLGK